MEWTSIGMITPNRFLTEISPFLNPNLSSYIAALIADDCWQAIPGRVISILHEIGVDKGGTIFNDSKVMDVERRGFNYFVTVKHNLTGEKELLNVNILLSLWVLSQIILLKR